MKKNQINKQPWWQLSPDEVCKIFNTNQNQGLLSTQVQERLTIYGPNQLPKTKKISVIALFLAQFSSVIIWVLLGALIISALLGDTIDALAIGIIIFVNAIIGFIQEYHAEKSIAALKKLTKPSSRVIRNGIQSIISSHDIVPGDLIELEAGDSIPADGRLIQTTSLRVQEASLTGESNALIKTIDCINQDKLPLGDRKNMAFMGTSVVQGKGIMLVTATASHTELGTIATTLQSITTEQTPLQLQLTQIGHRLVALCLGAVSIILLLGILRGHELVAMLFTSLSLAVAAIPEGLPTVITITLSLGAHRLVRKNALIRRLASVETLGCTSIICTDKTGTLTKNEMIVEQIWVNNHLITVSGTGYKPEGKFTLNNQVINPHEHTELKCALTIGVLCNDANLVQQNTTWTITGDPTEGALLVAAAKANLHKPILLNEHQIRYEIPFDSERKCMSIIRQTPQGNILYIKGAPETLLEKASAILLNGQEAPLTNEQKNHILQNNTALAEQALRVLGVAYRKNIPELLTDTLYEHDLVFVGLIAMIDPLRTEVFDALKLCKKANIRTIMITGDHQATALAIAKKLHILDQDSQVLTGLDLDTMDDTELKKHIQRVNVYARVSAEHKLRIVNMLKSLDEVVAVTGDGVNDAPAIKAADIGIAMGTTGTEVTKEVSDMIILDDNFASIVHAIEEGRAIYDNIVKFINYLTSSNLAELMIIFIGTMIGLTDPTGKQYIALLPIQLLWLNLVTDGFPALALGIDPISPNAMSQPPRKKKESLFSPLFISELCIISLTIASGALIASYVGLKTNAILGHTMALTSFVVLEFVRIHLIRSSYHLSFFSNLWLILALSGSFVLHLFVVYNPWAQTIFKTTALSPTHWLIIGIIAIGVWICGALITKLFEYLKANKRFSSLLN